MDKYADDPTVVVNGPGGEDLDHRRPGLARLPDLIVDSIADLGGMACVNTTAVLYEGDPAGWHGRSPSGFGRSRHCRPMTSGRCCRPSRLKRHARWRRAAAKAGEPSRCWGPIKWWPRWGTGTQHYARRCTCWRARRRQAQHRVAVSLRVGGALVARSRGGSVAAFAGGRCDPAMSS